mmetsp:Transcript_61698/g.145087  ORF Transcript_61698/g.145087 Transcript_61698/m.145087 type:complete len:256 (-) Transcript_61698:7-774(-)
MARIGIREWGLVCALCIASMSAAQAGMVEDIPKCPTPCGDNPQDLCPDGDEIEAEGFRLIEYMQGLKEDNYWDIRVDSVHKAKFSVMIFDKENYDKFAAGDIDYRACTEHKELNKEQSCLSLNGKFCRKTSKKAPVPDYTHVVIQCEEPNVSCPLQWHVGVMMMKHTKCTSLGMPCSVTTALLWLFILGGLGVAMFLHRAKIADYIASAGMPDMSSMKWRIFSGRFSNGVEEMEARLKQGGAGGDGGTAEPYNRL